MKVWSATLYLTFLLWASGLEAASIEKIEPPGWWAVHSINPVRVLITGRDLKAVKVAAPTGFVAGPVKVTANGRYAFFDLRIPLSAKPGIYDLQLGDARGKFELYAPMPRTGRFQGFSSDDVVYLIMPDRFANGDPANDGAVDRTNLRAWHGGDFKGVSNNLAYLKDLGVTAIWLTPIYAGSDYHGYHATDHYAVQPRFGRLDEWRSLVDAAHANGIKVIQDQVLNHVGPQHPWAETPPSPSWLNGSRAEHLNGGGPLWPLIDPHSAPALRRAILEGWFVDRLPDLNQNDPELSRYLIQNSLWWIGISGIDGIRMDTVAYVPKRFWREWNAAVKRQYPSLSVAGEVYNEDPFVIDHFKDAGFETFFDFPLYFATRRAAANFGELPAALSRDALFAQPQRMLAFLGSHDVPRFRQQFDAEALKNAFTFLMTTRRTPVIYYGDEIAMMGGGDPDNRRDFPGAAAGNATFAHVSKLLHLRKSLAPLRRGSLVTLSEARDHYIYLRRADPLVVVVAFGKPRATAIDVPDTDPQADALGSGATAQVTRGQLQLTGPGVFVFSLKR